MKLCDEKCRPTRIAFGQAVNSAGITEITEQTVINPVEPNCIYAGRRRHSTNDWSLDPSRRQRIAVCRLVRPSRNLTGCCIRHHAKTGVQLERRLKGGVRIQHFANF